MGERLRRMFEDELLDQQPPPVSGLVERARADGRRIRRNRMIRSSLLVMVLSGLLFGSIGLLRFWTPGSPVTGSQAAAVKPSSAAPAAGTAQQPPAVDPGPHTSGSPSPSPSSGARVTATPAGLLQLVVGQLPEGRTSNFAGIVRDGTPVGQLYLDRGKGPGMVRITVASNPSGVLPTCRGLNIGLETTACEIRPDGTVVQQLDVMDSCTQRKMIIGWHPDHAVVTLFLASCLAYDGNDYPTGNQALSVTEAANIAADPRLGPTLDAGYVTLGAAKFPKLPPIEG